jgi:hypothetical protein
MARCSRCDVETDYCLLGIPICPRCDQLLLQMAADLNSTDTTPELFFVKTGRPHDDFPIDPRGRSECCGRLIAFATNAALIDDVP